MAKSDTQRCIKKAKQNSKGNTTVVTACVPRSLKLRLKLSWLFMWFIGHIDPCAVLGCSVLSDSFSTPWTVACQAPLSMEFSRKEYRSGLPFPPTGDLPRSGLKPISPVSSALAGKFFTSVPYGKVNVLGSHHKFHIIFLTMWWDILFYCRIILKVIYIFSLWLRDLNETFWGVSI